MEEQIMEKYRKYKKVRKSLLYCVKKSALLFSILGMSKLGLGRNITCDLYLNVHF